MATHQVYLSYGGSNVFNFASGSNTLVRYVPQSADLTTIDSNSIIGDGGERPLTTRRNVTESLSFYASASTNTLIQSAKQYLQSIFIKAERYQRTGAGSPVYIYMQPYGTTASAYRSEILSGKVDMSDDSLGWRWNRKHIEIAAAFTRRYYWEGEEETVILANQSGTGSRIAIRNENLSGSNNYVEIAASAVVGEIPTPAKIILRNDSASSMSTRRFFFWHNVSNNPQSFTQFWQAESASHGSGASIVSNAAYSGGSAVIVPTQAGGTKTMIKLGLSGSFLDACAGGNFLISGYVANSILTSSSVYMKVSVQYNESQGFTTVGEGMEVKADTSADTNIQTFGIIKLPPTRIKTGAFSAHALYIKFRSSASQNVYFDTIQITPVDTGYSYIKQLGYTWVSGVAVFDYIEDEFYLSSSAYDSKVPIFVAGGTPIVLYPGELQRVYCLIEDFAHYYPHRTLNIEMKYRPRRLTI